MVESAKHSLLEKSGTPNKLITKARKKNPVTSMLRSIFICASLLAISAKATCECGYKTNTGETWQYSINTDFSQLNTSHWLDSADWSVVEIVREATVNLNYTNDNVALSEGKLQLTCSAYNSSGSGGIRSGEIRTTR